MLAWIGGEPSPRRATHPPDQKGLFDPCPHRGSHGKLGRDRDKRRKLIGDSHMFRGLRFEVLGPVRGFTGETELHLGSPQQRGVLAMLLLARGRQVSMDGLIDGLWGADVPRAAGGTIRTYISRLRHCLDADAGRGELIESIGDGYLVPRDAAVLDLDQFEEGLGKARTACQCQATAQAVSVLRDTLGLWRGTALAGVPGPYAESRRVRLAELHLVATEEKLAMDIAIGQHGEAVAELRELLAEHPFREGLSELLMLGLYRSGRQAEALAVFNAVRQQLGAELGIDPGLALQEMHQRVLQADQHLMGVAV
ncbi:MAG: AfsR/SARP family transcriptional regulator [Trebonia sp.]|jgi:DNA-binding SARP family transcriptional activator